MPAIRPVVASVAAWILGAVAAVSVGLIALTLIGSGLSDQPVQPLSPHGLGQPLLTQPAPTLSGGVGSLGTTSPPADTARDQTVSSPGGTVVARCGPRGAYLVGWSPAPGYRAEDVKRGPAEEAKLKFEGEGREIQVSIRCDDGIVRPTIEDEVDHT